MLSSEVTLHEVRLKAELVNSFFFSFIIAILLLMSLLLSDVCEAPLE